MTEERGDETESLMLASRPRLGLGFTGDLCDSLNTSSFSKAISVSLSTFSLRRSSMDLVLNKLNKSLVSGIGYSFEVNVR